MEQKNLTPEVVPEADGSWSFSSIRKANYALASIDRIDATPAVKNHWRGVARFEEDAFDFKVVTHSGEEEAWARFVESINR